jgi:hypothetical protein
MRQLYFKRTKLFLHDDAEGFSHRYLGEISGARGPVPVPEWVTETKTYADGIKDKSIIDLTPRGADKKRQDAELKAENPGKTEDEIAKEAADAQPGVPLGIQPDSMPATTGGGRRRAAGATIA